MLLVATAFFSLLILALIEEAHGPEGVEMLDAMMASIKEAQ